MNTVFIIGNGFDINLGMETRFKNFLDYYLTVETDSDLIKELKKDISEKINDWSDLEKELGKYTEKVTTPEDFFKVYRDIKARLIEYLKNKESAFDFSNMIREKLLSYFAHPEKLLPPYDLNEIVQYRKQWKSSQWNIHIITLNYTRCIEKLLEYNGSNIVIQNNNNGYPIVFQKIEHVHGFLDGRMIMGVNDATQISNTSFKETHKITRLLIKNKCNVAHKQLVEVACQDRIREANLICIFGSSIGETDNMWWELIGEQLEKGCKLIIFSHKDKTYTVEIEDEIWEDEEAERKAFLDKTKLTEEQKEAVSKNIYVAINSDMFDIGQKDAVKVNALEPA